MTAFEYLTVLVSIIVGLGVTHLLSGLGALLGGTKDVRSYWPHTLWMCNVAFWFVFFWWFQFKWVTTPDWSFGLFLFVLGYAVLTYLIAMVLLPPDVPDSFDFHAHYFGRRHVFFSGLILLYIVDVIDAFTKGLENVRDLGVPWAVLEALLIIGAVVAIRTSSDAYHKVHAVLWPVLMITWILYSMGAVSALF
jgi:hypothetical protein